MRTTSSFWVMLFLAVLTFCELGASKAMGDARAFRRCGALVQGDGCVVFWPDGVGGSPDVSPGPLPGPPPEPPPGPPPGPPPEPPELPEPPVLPPFVLSNYGGLTLGDRVRVAGELAVDCESSCRRRYSCILDNTISLCLVEPVETSTWGAIKALYE
jgi:hypothetical protein